MNSSTSSSDAAKAENRRGARAWTRFALVLAGGAAALMALLVGVIYVLDPYDAGRPGWIVKPGVRPQGPRTAAASRGRDPAFDAAIFGNSHVQLLSPERLNGLTGMSFVSLIAPATLPKEQFVLLDWYLRHRKSPAKAIIIGVDGHWCTGDVNLTNEKPFPFWLYERSLPAYLRGMLRYDMLEEAPRRVAYLLARKPERARPDGYWDYEPNYIGLGYDVRPERRAILEEGGRGITHNPTVTFPAADRLAQMLREVPPQTQVILLHPPIYISTLAREGDPQWATEVACKAAFAKVASQRPNTTVLDWRIQRPEVKEAGLWFDHSHYRMPIALGIEQDIGRLLRRAP
jgi:hypothetical protein